MLRRRPDAELPPLHLDGGGDVSADTQESSGPAATYYQVIAHGPAHRASDAGWWRHDPEPETEPVRDRPAAGQTELDLGFDPDRRGTARQDIRAALEAARRTQRIIAKREQRAGREAGLVFAQQDAEHLDGVMAILAPSSSEIRRCAPDLRKRGHLWVLELSYRR